MPNTHELPAPDATRPDAFDYCTLNQIARSRTNPRRRFDQERLAELAGSLAEHGMVQPIVVRPTGENDQYEIVAGERRYLAACMNGWEWIPCLIRDLTDQQVLEIQVVENNQRQDLDPIEEADGLARLIESGAYGGGEAAVESIAAKLGRSRRYIYNRLKLRELSEETRELLDDGTLTVSHAEILSRLSPAQQREATDSWRHWGRYPSVRDLSDYVRRHVLRLVDSFPFPTTDPELVPAAGPCSTCPKNTKNSPDLFPDEVDAEKGMCTDPACYDAKREAYVGRRAEEVRAEHGTEAALVSTGYGPRDKNILPYGSYSEVKPGTKGASVAVVADGPEIGRVLTIKQTPSGFGGRGLKRTKSSEEIERERKAAEMRHYRRALLAAIEGEAPGWECRTSDPVDQLLRAIGRHLLRRCDTASGRQIAARFELVHDPKGFDYQGAIAELLARTSGVQLIPILARLNFHGAAEVGYRSDIEELEAIGEAFGIDLALLKREAAEAHPIKKLEHDALRDAPIPELTEGEAAELAAEVAAEIDAEPPKKTRKTGRKTAAPPPKGRQKK